MVSLSNHRWLGFESGDKLKMDRHQSPVSLFKISAEPLTMVALLFTWFGALWSFVALKHVPVKHALTVGEGPGSVEAATGSKTVGNPNHNTLLPPWTGRLQSALSHGCLLILSLSKDARSSCPWRSRLATSSPKETLRSTSLIDNYI